MRKKTKIVVLLTLIFCFFSISSTYAADKWFTCTVDTVGPKADKVFLRLTDTKGAFSKVWFKDRGENSVWNSKINHTLATALTAASSGMELQVYMDDSATPYQEIKNIYLMGN